MNPCDPEQVWGKILNLKDKNNNSKTMNLSEPA